MGNDRYGVATIYNYLLDFFPFFLTVGSALHSGVCSRFRKQISVPTHPSKQTAMPGNDILTEDLLGNSEDTSQYFLDLIISFQTKHFHMMVKVVLGRSVTADTRMETWIGALTTAT